MAANTFIIEGLLNDLTNCIRYYLDDSFCVLCGCYLCKYEVPVNKICHPCLHKQYQLIEQQIVDIEKQLVEITNKCSYYQRIISTKQNFMAYQEAHLEKYAKASEELLSQINICQNNMNMASNQLTEYLKEYQDLFKIIEMDNSIFMQRRAPGIIENIQETIKHNNKSVKKYYTQYDKIKNKSLILTNTLLYPNSWRSETCDWSSICTIMLQQHAKGCKCAITNGLIDNLKSCGCLYRYYFRANQARVKYDEMQGRLTVMRNKLLALSRYAYENRNYHIYRKIADIYHYTLSTQNNRDSFAAIELFCKENGIHVNVNTDY